MHYGPRAFLSIQAKRRDPFAQLLVGPRRGIEPYPAIERIRGRGRVVHTPFAWVTADHEICRTILRDNRFIASPPEELDLPRPLPWVLSKTDPKITNPVEPPSMLMIDPPEHTRHRHAVARTFTPRAIGQLHGRVEQLTDQLLDELAAKQRPDLIRDFALQLPAAVISEILGMPEEHRPQMLEWGESGAPLLDLGLSWRTFQRAMAGLRSADDYLSAHIERLRAAPGDNLLSELVANDELSKRELMSTASLLIGAGFETTVNLIGAGFVLLAAHPDQLAMLRADPTRWPAAVDEILRFDSPVQMTARTAGCDIELAGKRIPEGAMIVPLIGGANRDPGVFADPDIFDISRSNAKEHLSFGSGIHSCLGASLARMEGAIALQALFDRFPDLRLDGQPKRRALVTLRGYDSLPVTLAPSDQIAAANQPHGAGGE
ncbi:cytochrome P450 [Antrihabitans cavernicola]|uniref:Cytochrome P450 n=2 Tax=Antrihabitans cavernicola TaxID=2495913 RepID=A0A5A7S7G6_9NOCA|nr:cytochrome P450 [Spelaeibacter cavernicola]